MYSYRLWTPSVQLTDRTKPAEGIFFWFLIHSILLPRHKHSTDVPLKSSVLPLSRSLPHARCSLLYLDGGGWAIEEETNTEFLKPMRHRHTISNWAVHPGASTTCELPTNTRLQSEIHLQKARLLSRITVSVFTAFLKFYHDILFYSADSFKFRW